MYSEVMKREIQQRLTWIELYELTNDLVRYVDVVVFLDQLLVNNGNVIKNVV